MQISWKMMQLKKAMSEDDRSPAPKMNRNQAPRKSDRP